MLEKYSTCLGIREMQIKVVLRRHPIPERMATMKRTKGSKCFWGSGGRGALVYCWWQIGVATVEISKEENESYYSLPNFKTLEYTEVHV